MRRRHPPLPGSVRPAFWVFRGLGVLVGLVAVVCAVLLARQEEWGYVAWALAIGVPVAVLPWLSPMSSTFAALLASVGLIMGFFTRAWLLAAVLCAIAGWNLWNMRRPVGAGIKLDLKEIDPGTVMKGAERNLESVASSGFRQVGAYGGRYRWFNITVTLLLSPDSRSWASVTDAVCDVTSLFPDGRRLVTRNSHFGTLPPNVLVNPSPGAALNELIASHRRALEILAAHGQVPLPLSDDQLVSIAIDTEMEAMEWGRVGKTRWRREPAVPLWDQSHLEDRVSAWVAWA